METSGPELWAAHFPWPDVETHKHSRGRLGVVSGPPHRTGAARLAARAGLRVGAGLVRVLCPPSAVGVLAASLEAVMVDPFDGPGALAKLAGPLDAVVIGPAAGVDEGTVEALDAVAQSGAALVVDADALTVFEGRTDDLFAHLDRDDVLTPHEGEFERIFPGLLERGREAAVAEAARRADAVVLLKGARTLVAGPEGRMAVTPQAPAWLATAGSGDVLAGLIGGLIAQRMPSFEAAACAAWLHARAADLHGPGLIAADLPEMLPEVLADLWEARPQSGKT
jgi:ADP-dependent NAD(P)H-hydrate dehydratase / NAD(P)H-hydrate epimerase